MGLDMYLSRKLYVKHWDYKGDDNYVITVKKNKKAVKWVNPKKISYIVEEFMYWRKANAIHKWFVDNVQGGKDDCGDYYVDPEKLKELRDLCKKVLDKARLVEGRVHVGTSITDGVATEKYEDGKVIKNAKLMAKLLPTSSGFFFGSTEYNEWYLQDAKDTYECLSSIDFDNDPADFYYGSSW